MAGSLSAGTVSLTVKPDTSEFGPKLKAAVLQDSGNIKGIGSSIGSTLMAGLGAVGIASSIAGFFKSGFDEAKDAAAGQAQLEAGIKSTGNAANVSVKGMEDLASSIQGYSGQTDDSIVKSEQLLLTFTNIKNNGPDKIFDEATRASADMAAKMGGDASSNAILLGKALNDPAKGISALTRVGVSFTDEQKKSIKAMQATGDTAGAQKIILKELGTEFGGAAKAAGDSMPGKLQIAQRKFEDLTQTVVTYLIPAITGTVDVLTGLFSFITDNLPTVATFVGVLGGLLIAFNAATIAIKIATFAQWLMNAAFLANPMVLVAIAIAALIAGIVYLATKTTFFQDTWRIMSKFVTDAIHNVGKVFNDIWNGIVKFFGGVGKTLSGVWNGFIKLLTGAWDGVKNAFQTAFGFIGGLFRGYVNIWLGIFETFINFFLNGINNMLGGLNSVLDGIKIASGGTINLHINTIPNVALPRLAEGGIVPATPGGRTVTVAEAGQAEAIIPLSKLGDMGSVNKNADRPIFADGIGLLGWVREVAHGESKLVFNTQLANISRGAR